MSKTNSKAEVLNLLKNYKEERIVFPKTGIEEQLSNRSITKDQIIKNLIIPKNLVFAEKQERKFRGSIDIRYNCYFLFSKSKAHRYILSFGDKLKVITAIPLGRKTLNKISAKKILEELK